MPRSRCAPLALSRLLAATVAFGAPALAEGEPATRQPDGAPAPFTSAPATHPAHRAAYCYRNDLNVAQMLEAMQRWGLLPPGERMGDADFFLDSLAWIGEGLLTNNGAAQPAILTYSFPPDGTHWGSETYAAGPSDLMASLSNAFGPQNLDQGLEIMRQGIAGFRVAALSFREEPDDGMPWGTPDPGAPLRGLIRISGLPFGESFVGYSSYPAGGADVAINTAVFVTGNLASNANNYRYLRNTMAHEMGHALGLAHTVPCENSKVMEPVLAVAVDGLTVDDIRGAQRNYGDIFAGNGWPEFAADLGDLASPAPRALRFENLSTNGSGSTFLRTNEDWFRFSLSSAQTVRLGLDQRGGQYRAARQELNCTPDNPPIINAQSAGALRLELRNAEGTSILATGSAPPGQPQRLTQFLQPGQYTIRVVDIGPNVAGDLLVQLYDFFAEAGATPIPAPPRAIAGVGKRIRANDLCYFMGDIHSRAVGAGAALTTQSFDWDLNGDGVFERENDPRPVRRYYSNGEYPVTLRVTDTNGQTATDTIPLVVHGAQTIIAFVQPPNIPRGSTTPITILGANLRSVLSAGEVTVSGFGVTVSGAPVADPEGVSLTGLSLSVQLNAAEGPRTIFIANADGQGVGVDLVHVVGPTSCPGDANGDLRVDAIDLNATLGQYTQTGAGLSADFNNDQRVDFLDLNIVLSNFGVEC